MTISKLFAIGVAAAALTTGTARAGDISPADRRSPDVTRRYQPGTLVATVAMANTNDATGDQGCPKDCCKRKVTSSTEYLRH